MAKNAAKREYYPVNDNDQMIVDIEKDSEQPVVLCHLYQKRDATPDNEKNDEKYLRGDYVDGLVASMLNDRLTELRQQAVPPFQSATARVANFFLSRTKESFSLSISCKENNVLGGLIAAVGAAERARQHGFTQTELQRAKSQKLAHDERKYRERDDRRNAKYVTACVQNFLNSEPLISMDHHRQGQRHRRRRHTLSSRNHLQLENQRFRQTVHLLSPD